ncbi:hypothetical protein G9A89_015021 [Geosiphon pyriformis]|nr:hypothetical protein G9A89_015021 [Geosiphon pyriformis]
MTYDLGTLLKRAGEKTCIINKFLETGNKICCAVVGFEFDDNLKSAFYTEPILGSVKLSWAKMDLVWYEKCRKFGYSVLKCDAPVVSPSKPSKPFKRVASDECCLKLAKLYEKKDVLISCSAVFGGKSWAQVVSLAHSFGDACFKSGFGSPPLGNLCLSGTLSSTSDINSGLSDHLIVLECFLEFLSDQVSVLLEKLSFVELVPLTVFPSAPLLVASVSVALVLDSDMVLNNVLLPFTPFLSVGSDLVANFSSSSSKILTTKIGELESKMVVLEVLVKSVLEKLNWFLGAGVAIIMNTSLAHHVSKVSKVSGQLLSVKLLFKGKLSVSILGLYAGVSLAACFFQANNINSMIANMVNKSLFVVLDGNFNEDGSQKCASFKKCLDFGLVYSLDGSFYVKVFT